MKSLIPFECLGQVMKKHIRTVRKHSGEDLLVQRNLMLRSALGGLVSEKDRHPTEMVWMFSGSFCFQF